MLAVVLLVETAAGLLVSSTFNEAASMNEKPTAHGPPTVSIF